MIVNEAYILLGSNLGDRQVNLSNAMVQIALECGIITKRSLIYETEPWGFEGVPDFLNQIIIVQTRWQPLTLLIRLLEIEAQLGRVRNPEGNYISRTIDIDLLYFADQIIESSALTIPHPRLHLRNFALRPLAEISPDFVHPVLRQSSKMLLEKSVDPSKVRVFEPLKSVV